MPIDDEKRKRREEKERKRQRAEVAREQASKDLEEVFYKALKSHPHSAARFDEIVAEFHAAREAVRKERKTGQTQ